MRLIDADELKYCHTVKAVMSPMGSAILKEVKINEIPTAFDLESVIEQLEKKSKWAAYNNWDRDIGMTHKVVPFGEIVEILKSAANATNGKNGG